MSAISFDIWMFHAVKSNAISKQAVKPFLYTLIKMDFKAGKWGLKVFVLSVPFTGFLNNRVYLVSLKLTMLENVCTVDIIIVS